MIAYNLTGLHHAAMRREAAQALRNGELTAEEMEAIRTRYPAILYTPNIFIRIGLFALTCVILVFSFGLFALIFAAAIEEIAGGMAIFFGLVTYVALENLVKRNNHFKSGVDDALLWISAGCVFGGLSYITGAGGFANSLLLCLLAGYASLRFGDRLMALLVYAGMLGILFFSLSSLGTIARALIPFAAMLLSLFFYLAMTRVEKRRLNYAYGSCIQVLLVTALLGVYLCVNYYVVREAMTVLFDLPPGAGISIQFGWIFWLLTAAIPAVYLVLGVRKKNRAILRLALLLVAASVVTFRNYYPWGTIEAFMTGTGLAMAIIAYALTRYFKVPHWGLSNDVTGRNTQGTHAESLLVAQGFSITPAPADATNFGGGGFGGGGASSGF